MSILPRTLNSLLVRTDFSDQTLWESVLSAATAQNADGFRAYVEVVDDPDQADATWQDLRRAVVTNDEHAAVAFVVDQTALMNEYPVLVVDLTAVARPPFRCVAGELWAVDNNLNISNMDWDEFADVVDSDGVFRGFN